MKTFRDQYILIADAHIRGGTENADQFFRMLDHLPALNPAGIVFLGDIFELWVALDGYETPEHKRLVRWCELHKKAFEIGFIEGNHEFFVGDTHRDAFSWVTDSEHRLNDKIALSHGDTINRKDWKYLLLRGAIRNAFTKFLLKLFARSIGPKVTDQIRLSLKHKNLAHKKYLPIPELERFGLACTERGLQTIAAGHFHARKRMELPAGLTIDILPAWENAGEVALMNTDGELECLPWESLATSEKSAEPQ